MGVSVYIALNKLWYFI